MLARRRLLLAWFARRSAVAFAGGEVSQSVTARTAATVGGGEIQQLSMIVSEPAAGAIVAFPFPASGYATVGATVTCYNDGTGAVLDTVVAADGTWALTISGSV
jgi:hypothetical protein